jgi:transcriptional regulator with XRE-family HTH domain
MAVSETVRSLLARLKALRKQAGVTTAQMDERLLIGPGWTERFENGEVAPSIDLLVAMLNILNVPPQDFFAAHDWDTASRVPREMWAEQAGKDLLIHFRYNDYDAEYRLKGATLQQFEDVLRVLRSRLAGEERNAGDAMQTDAVAETFLATTRAWPTANPSDLWWFLVARAYCDPFNHPAANAHRDFGQSWKRTGGWALEEVLVRHYGPFLRAKGVDIVVAKGEQKERLLGQLRVDRRLEAAKVDVLLTGARRGQEVCFGVVHVKASFAERRTDDVPLSQTLIRAGYTSPLWTMDCKSSPSAHPLNRGELGVALDEGPDRRSNKRRDIEEDGYFTACFSYNSRTAPTPADQAARARVTVCDFRRPNDGFARYVLSEWQRFTRREA